MYTFYSTNSRVHKCYNSPIEYIHFTSLPIECLHFKTLCILYNVHSGYRLKRNIKSRTDYMWAFLESVRVSCSSYLHHQYCSKCSLSSPFCETHFLHSQRTVAIALRISCCSPLRFINLKIAHFLLLTIQV